MVSFPAAANHPGIRSPAWHNDTRSRSPGAEPEKWGLSRPGAILNQRLEFELFFLIFNLPRPKTWNQFAANEMHYIRLMRPLSLDERNRLRLVFTITTDLGDSFLCPDEPVPISVYAYNSTSAALLTSGEKVRIDNGGKSWTAGMRILKLDLPISTKALQKLQARVKNDGGSIRIRVVACHDLSDPPNASEIPFDTTGRVLGLSIPFPQAGQDPCYTATRELATHDGSTKGLLEIDEEIGESIDRHVWDAGVVTTGLIMNICNATGEGPKWQQTPLLENLLRPVLRERPLNVIELGCGVGILGIGLARALARRPAPTRTKESSPDDAQTPPTESSGSPASADSWPERSILGSVLLTDLPDAEELTRRNIDWFACHRKDVPGDTALLEFESLDWEEGKAGVFGPKAGATGWDLVIISDCTYNVDMLSALVKTLSALHASSVALGSVGPKVLLATKPRHSSEKALFDLMKAGGWSILESASQPLPLLRMEDEKVEIYLFGKTSEQVGGGTESAKPAAKRRKMG